MTSIHSLNPNVVIRAKENAGPPKVLTNALNSADVQWILDKEERLRKDYFKQKQNNVQNINVDEELWNFVLSRANITEKLNKTGGNYFKTVNPFVIHTDTPHVKDIVPYKNFLIPLTGFSNCYTIFFQQRHYGIGAHFLRSNKYKNWSPDKNIKITDYSDLENYTGKDFPPGTYKEHLTHMPYDNLHGLSIYDIVQWKMGDIIVFDSAQLHCSNDFSKYENHDQKHALSLFTNLGNINENNI